MQGLAAITAQNGWAMAATGACIVIAGLSVLSFIISQLHRIIAFFEKKETLEAVKPPEIEPVPDPINIFSELPSAAKHLKSASAQLGETFHLADLYKAFEAAKDPHPHITVRELKSAGFLVPVDESKFSWKNV